MSDTASESADHVSMFPLGADAAPYRKLELGGVETDSFNGQSILKVAPETMRCANHSAVPSVHHLAWQSVTLGSASFWATWNSSWAA